uniref:sugar ABC transporter ATP-binding protein n=1 Tax=Candidatus Scatomorpha intestinigallinarum TaxID=2840923 RepID=UPI00402577C1
MEFSGVYVLSDMQLQVDRGSIHALVGENGAGKSTLIKILGGIYKPKTGKIFIDGTESSIHNVQDAQKKGISIIHQEISLVPSLSIAENVFLGRELSKLGFKSEGKMFSMAQEMIDALGIDLSARTIVSGLTIAQQQLVEIIKAVSFNTHILVLDEPTSSLSLKETQRLFDIIRRLQGKGVATIYISHKMDEIFEISDHITVIRDGRYIDTVPTSQTSSEEVVRKMVGRSIEQFYVRSYNELSKVALRVENLTKRGVFADVNFEVRYGEVLGFAGLVGAGRSEIMHAVFGADKYDSGEILIDGSAVHISCPQQAISLGMSMVPESRKEQGLVLINDVGFNIALANVDRLKGRMFLSCKKRHALACQYIERMHIKTRSDAQAVFELSGGNQQKVLLGKWLANQPKILILDEPTRGVDVGAKTEIYAIINELAAEGMAIILVSSELSEIINMCDNVCVVHEGRITGRLSREEFSQDKIMHYATGGEDI